MPKKQGKAKIVRRPNAPRRELPFVVVVCDDSKAAIRYFEALRDKVRSSVSLRVFSFPNATPVEMYQKAKREAGGQKRDSAWVLIDREALPETQWRADQAKGKLDGRKCMILLSNPCFEVWTLAHLVDTGSSFDDCNAVLAQLKHEWSKQFKEEFKKTQADYRKLMDRWPTALKRAKRHCLRNCGTACSWTEVYKVAEAVAAAMPEGPC